MIDLHIHSLYSDDGEFTPEELVKKCAAQGIQWMAVTDHNCVRANEEAARKAAGAGIRYTSGIEIDCVYEHVNFHVLGYAIDAASSDFAGIEENVRTQSLRASRLMLEKTRALGFSVEEAEMEHMARGRYWSESWTGEMFAELLLSRPEYKDNVLLLPYREEGVRGDNPYVNFYWDFYAQGKPCYVPVAFPQMEEILDIIHQNHGVAVLAHPGVNLKNTPGLLNDIAELGIDGLEAFSSYHSLRESERYSDFASQNHLFVTCGSDFHGKIKPSIGLGKHGGRISQEALLHHLSGR